MFGIGSIAFATAAHEEWPPPRPIKLEFRSNSVDAMNRAHVNIDISGVVIVEIFGHDGSCRTLKTPRIELELGTSLRAAFRWNEDDAELAVGGKVLARFPEVEGAAQEIYTVTKRQRRKPDVQQALLDRSTEVQAERVVREAGVQPPPTSPGRTRKRLRTVAENVRALSERTLALAEVAEAARQGRGHHLVGVASMLRLLACNAGGSHRPLLLRTAGLLQMPLWAYGHSPSIHQPLNGHWPDHSDYSLLRAEVDEDLYKMDLEVWLENTGYCFQGQTKTNNELLKLLGNEDGAHFDPCVSPEVELWNSITSFDSALRRDILLRTATAIVQISARLTNSEQAKFVLKAA